MNLQECCCQLSGYFVRQLVRGVTIFVKVCCQVIEHRWDGITARTLWRPGGPGHGEPAMNDELVRSLADCQRVVEIRRSQVAEEHPWARVLLFGGIFPVCKHIMAVLGFGGCKRVSDNMSERRIEIGQRHN